MKTKLTRQWLYLLLIAFAAQSCIFPYSGFYRGTHIKYEVYTPPVIGFKAEVRYPIERRYRTDTTTAYFPIAAEKIESKKNKKGEHYYKVRVKRTKPHSLRFSGANTLPVTFTPDRRRGWEWRSQMFALSGFWQLFLDAPAKMTNTTRRTKIPVDFGTKPVAESKEIGLLVRRFIIDVPTEQGENLVKEYVRNQNYPGLADYGDTVLTSVGYNTDIAYGKKKMKDVLDDLGPLLAIDVKVTNFISRDEVDYYKTATWSNITYKLHDYDLVIDFEMTLKKGEKILTTKKITQKVSSFYPESYIGKFKEGYAAALGKFLSLPENEKIFAKGYQIIETKELKEQIVYTKSDKDSVKMGERIRSVVLIENKESFGSGFYINDAGYILTNWHVIDDADTLFVTDKVQKRAIAKVISFNEENDLALLKITSAEKTPFIPMQDKKVVEVGDNAFAIGNPVSKKLSASLSRGIISGSREVNGKEVIQIDVPINSGNSGGPLLNQRGALIGVINSKIKGGNVEGIGFAIPTTTVENFLKSK